MRIVKRFEPLSVMKIAAVCYAGVGLLEGVLFSVIFSILPIVGPPQAKMPQFFGPLLGAFSILVFPILFAIIGGISAALGAVIYNLAARFVGGIQVEVE
ncbi:MAG TPA: DUF3566 domain-containing protein [Candidatus Dormibacteraeota bacterium]|nr:DUF3566 domain-containing protein [Candidatus Dormibacteraeota bacterium]